MRPSKRQPNQLREVKITRHYTKHAEGSVLIEFGDTRVLCTASVKKQLPRFIKEQNLKQGWLTSEYGMLPRSTNTRVDREAARGKQSGRTQEIQRLIGRSLRSAIDLALIPEYTITIDCDVIQADGGTRTAAITGGCVALADAVNHMYTKNLIGQNPMKHLIASVSAGIYENMPVLDLDYTEDANCETDMNFVMNDEGGFIEIQGTAEGNPLHQKELDALLILAKEGIATLIQKQKEALELTISTKPSS